MADISYLGLKRNCKKDASGLIVQRFAILGDCATQHLATAIKGYAYDEGYAFEVFDADYDQIGAQVMDDASELYAFSPRYVLIYMCVEKLYEAFCAMALGDRADFADKIYEKIFAYWALVNRHITTHILQFTFVQRDDRVFGNFAPKTKTSFAYQVHRLNGLLADGCQQVANVSLIDLNEIRAALGEAAFYDSKLYYIAKVPLSMEALPKAAKAVMDTVNALNGRVKKCVVLDLDGTLWGGVVGDDGVNGIQIGELGAGHAFSAFQAWLKELKNRGVLLAVCSKNNEEAAKEPFLKHPEMVLRLEDFSLFVANWEDKARNIRYIQQTLNIGMDSMVFLDDNPFERNLVRSLIPEIAVPELPEDPALYLGCLQSLNLFETASYTEEDLGRTDQYRAEAGRTEMQGQLGSFEEYLEALEMEAEAAPFDPYHCPRIAQLTQRSNQFNLRTVRYSEAEIKAIARDDRHITRYFCLKDKFGDHGLVSVVILDKPALHPGQAQDALFISEWLMSCRVLKRGMEEFIVNHIVGTAAEHGYSRAVGEYIKTPKNAMVERIYEKLGFTDEGGGRFAANIDGFQRNKTLIRGKGDPA
jgi:FkbH-like protein